MISQALKALIYGTPVKPPHVPTRPCKHGEEEPHREHASTTKGTPGAPEIDQCECLAQRTKAFKAAPAILRPRSQALGLWSPVDKNIYTPLKTLHNLHGLQRPRLCTRRLAQAEIHIKYGVDTW